MRLIGTWICAWLLLIATALSPALVRAQAREPNPQSTPVTQPTDSVNEVETPVADIGAKPTEPPKSTSTSRSSSENPWKRVVSGTHEILDYPMFTVGGAKITLGGTLWVLGILFAAWFTSRWLQRGLERYGKHRPEVSRPALYALGRILHYLLIAIGIGVALSSIGLDLTKVAFFASALGVGIGFGLQSVVNNFISGLILLLRAQPS